MTLPLSTTTVRVERADNLTGDPYASTATLSTIASGVRAHISAPAGSESTDGGERETLTWRLLCDDCDLRHQDEVVDERTGHRYEVRWVADRTGAAGLGLGHLAAGLRRIQGAAL